MNGTQLRVVELYAGTARSSDAFRHWKRCALSLQIDNDPVAAKTYLENFPGAPYLLRDLTQVKSNELLTLAGGRVDILLGCPPCQGFSDSGKRNPSDPRNSHLRNFARFAVALKPMAVAVENVPLAGGASQFWKFVHRMEHTGYVWNAAIINAALRGSSQCRQRLVYIAIRKDIGSTPIIPPPTHGGSREYFSYRFGSMKSLESDPVGMLGETPATKRVRKLLPYQEFGFGKRNTPQIMEVLDDLPKVGTSNADRLCHRPWAHKPWQLRRMRNVQEGGRWDGGRDHFSQSYGRLHRSGLARTITTYFSNPGSGRFWHPWENRALTVREAARIQGFPDSFHFCPPFSRAAVLVGNALDSSIARLTYEIIRANLE